MSNELEVSTMNEFKPVAISGSGNVAVSASRESFQVVGAIMAAHQFPRDKFKALNNILESCQRYALAERATYSYPRGGQTVAGPSIRLAEVLAQSWGNLDYGIVEIERKDDESIMQAYCWDLETNTRRTMNFTVGHYRDSKQGKKKLTEERDIYEAVANYGARRVRACVLSVIPGDVVEKAVDMCNKTISKGTGAKPKEERIFEVVRAFDKLGIPKEQLDKRLGRKFELATEEELAEYIGIGNSIREGMTTRNEWFDFGDGIQSEATSALNEKFKPDSKKQTREPGQEID